VEFLRRAKKRRKGVASSKGMQGGERQDRLYFPLNGGRGEKWDMSKERGHERGRLWVKGESERVRGNKMEEA